MMEQTTVAVETRKIVYQKTYDTQEDAKNAFNHIVEIQRKHQPLVMATPFRLLSIPTQRIKRVNLTSIPFSGPTVVKMLNFGEPTQEPENNQQFSFSW